MHRRCRADDDTTLEERLIERCGPSTFSGNLAAIEASPGVTETKSPFRFGRMFPNLDPFQPTDDEGLVELGNAMQDGPDAGENPGLPSGYTFLAQFIAHDVSLDLTRDVPKGPLALKDVKQGCSPFLDLRSIYGNGPLSEKGNFYKANEFVIGDTSPDVLGDADRSYHNDLPRAKEAPGKALIGDSRNDENLGVAQMHVAFLRFHNSVARRLQGDLRKDLFGEIRKKVIQHYQWIVLTDFLPRIVDESVLRKCLKNPPENFKTDFDKDPFMPIEFAAAAFRLGHSLLRDRYEWNRVYQSPRTEYSGPAGLYDLALQTGESGTLNGVPTQGHTLPSNWIIDWTRFFDFTGHDGITTNPKLNFSGKIDSTIARSLKPLGRFMTKITESKFKSLAVLDLVRGSRLGLPTGQDVAEALGLEPLTPADVAMLPHSGIVRKYGFDTKTPLWFYVLKEAEVVHGGRRLGPVGSRIVAETLVELIRHSPHSILEQGKVWKPDLGQIDRDSFRMTDFLIVANVVNPLGS